MNEEHTESFLPMIRLSTIVMKGLWAAEVVC